MDELEFVGELPGELVCCICRNGMLQPIFTNCCEQRYCEGCWDRWIEKNHTCPLCRENDNVISTVRLPQVERKIGNCKVYCHNKHSGCKAEPEYKNYRGHLSTTNEEGCLYVQVDCPKCADKVFRKDREKHAAEECPKRFVTCEFCQTEGEYQDIVGDDHRSQCSSNPIPCPNKCGTDVLPRKLKVHFSSCDMATVPCQYSDFGCTAKVFRKDLKNHEEDSMKEHMPLFAKSHRELQRSFAVLQQSHDRLYHKLKSVGELVNSSVPNAWANTRPYALAYTILADSSSRPIPGDPLTLALSQTNQSSGHHSIIIESSNSEFKLEWKQVKEDGTCYFTVALSLVKHGAVKKFNLAVHVDNDKQYIRVCCGQRPHPQVLNFSNDRPQQLKIEFLLHKSRQCPCKQPECSCSTPGSNSDLGRQTFDSDTATTWACSTPGSNSDLGRQTFDSDTDTTWEC